MWNRTLFLLIFLIGFSCGIHAAAPTRLSVRYLGALPQKPGDPVVFEVSLKPYSGTGPAPVCAWRLSANGAPPFESGNLTLHAGSARCTTEARELGFLTLRVELPTAPPVTLTLPAAWNRLTPQTPAPPDLDGFWTKQKSRLALIPSDPLTNEISAPDPEIVCYDIQASAPGAPVSAYLAHRRSAAKKSLPALLLIPDAQVASARMDQAVSYAKQGALVLDFNFHGIANGQEPDFYKTLASGPLKHPFIKEPESALTDLYLRVLRAVDVLCERPEWDGQTVAALGIHQGATLALVAAALDSRVSFVAAAAPVLCDIGRAFSLNAKPWPGLEPVLPPGLAPELQAGSLLYLDCAHLGPRIRVPSHVSIGLYDALSPPAGVAAACNRFGLTPKVVLDDPESGGPSMRTREILDRAVREHLARKLGSNKR